MGSVTKQRPGGLYGALLYMYPRKFREYFGPTMAQTLDDMLAGEPSRSGRVAIWTRALADLPVSAAKEHISDGKDVRMNRNMKLVFAGVVTLLLLANVFSFWKGILHAREGAGIRRVTPVQLADAMQQDDFFSTYGGSALLFSGKVTNVEQKDGTTQATFYTGHAYTVTCQFSGYEKIKLGQQVSIAATGGSADRQPHGVLLHSCLLN